MVVRQQSRKLRALQQTLGKPIAEIVADYAPQPLNYRDIACEWQAAVAETFPELHLRFTTSDVYRTFKRHGVFWPTLGAALTQPLNEVPGDEL